MSRVRSKPRIAAAVSCAALSLWMVLELVPGEVATPSGAERVDRPAPLGSSPRRPPPRLAEVVQGPRPHAEAVRQEVLPTAQLGAPTFAERIERLCVLSARTAALAQDDEYEAAQALDAEARELLDATMEQFSDAGERALGEVVALPDVAAGASRLPGENTRLGVLQVVLAAELSRRRAAAANHGERARLDALTLAVLDSMPIGRNTAEMGDRVLHQQPYVQLAHEPMVLHLLQLAGQGDFSREIATRMLLTLWDNLEASGARSSDELSTLALLRLDDQDPSQVVAACRQLLSDPRYRDLALAWLKERADPALAHAIARLAGRELPPSDALVALRELSPMLQHTRGTFLAIGVRAPEVVADAYREQLAADTQPQLRRELVMGVGMLPDGSGLEVARLALLHDPSVEVRLQALFVHTVHGDKVDAEAAVNRVLDDPAVAADPMHLAAVVLALQNLEHQDANVMARLGARLQAMALAPRSRELLDGMLARSLPGGGR